MARKMVRGATQDLDRDQCPVCELRELRVQRDGDWRCRICRSTGVTLDDAKVVQNRMVTMHVRPGGVEAMKALRQAATVDAEA